MNEIELRRAISILSSQIRPADKNEDGASFYEKSEIKQKLQLSIPNIENKDLNKILRISGFKSSFVRVNNVVKRAIWTREATGADHMDVSKININRKSSVAPVILNNDQEAIEFISKNWNDFEMYMNEEIKQIHSVDPQFRNVSSQKINRILKLAGFSSKIVLYTENRYKITEFEKPKRKKPVKGDINKLLRSGLYKK